MGFRIALDACGKSFLDHWVIRNRTLELNSGERVALLGPNGSGKSTLMLLICGYLQPTEGKVSFSLDGKLIPNERIGAHISMCLPNMETFEEFTLLQLIHLHTSMRSMLCSSKSDDIIDLLNFSSNEAKRQIRFFSNGMRQRLKLGLALLTESSAVLLDEPLTNMDVQGRDLYYHWLEEFLGSRLLLVASNREDEYQACTRLIHVQEPIIAAH